MRAYYALVDDLVSEDEFEELVLSYSDGLKPDHDLHSAAALAAGKLGRLHTKIADIKKGPTLISFYCRIIDRYLPPDSEAAVNLLCELDSVSESGFNSVQNISPDLLSGCSEGTGNGDISCYFFGDGGSRSDPEYSDGGGRYVNTSSENYYSLKRTHKGCGDNSQDMISSDQDGSSDYAQESFSEFPSVRLMLLCGDETGEVILHFRNEMASAVMEIPSGSVIEVAARYKKAGEAYAADMQLSDQDIILREDGQDKIFYDYIRFVVLGIKTGNGTYVGSADSRGLSNGYFGSELSDDLSQPAYFTVLCGNGTETFTVFFRDSEIPEFLCEGTSLRAGNLIRIPSVNGDLRFTAGKTTNLVPAEEPVTFSYNSPSRAEAGISGSFICHVLSAGKAREFYSKNGEISYVRNLIVADVGYNDGSAGIPAVQGVETSGQNVVLWGENALVPISEGEIAVIVNGFVKNRDLSLSQDNSCSVYEIHVGTNSIVRAVTSEYPVSCRNISFAGVVIETPSGFIIEDGELCYLLSGQVQDLSNGIYAEVSGILYSMRIDVLNWSNVVSSDNNILKNISFLLPE